MMKLRTNNGKFQSNTTSKFELFDEQTPSTSSSIPIMRRCSTNSNEQHHSPDSPLVGRICKQNAKILNELDLNNERRTGSYADIFGILPDLKTNELNDKFPAINNFLQNGAKLIDVETLHLIQHELEELISQNVDYQKTIHGEITYMTTGEYPTIDLSDRQMPKFDTLRKQEQLKLRERAKHADSTQIISLIDLGILSSPEDEDVPNILDVPSRFWTWAKEYLRPITKDFVLEFEEKLVGRFDEKNIVASFCQPTVCSSSSPPNKQQKRKAWSDDYHEQRKPVKMAKMIKSPNLYRNMRNKNLSKGALSEDCMEISNGKLETRQNGLILPTNGLVEWSHVEKARKQSLMVETSKKSIKESNNHGETVNVNGMEIEGSTSTEEDQDQLSERDEVEPSTEHQTDEVGTELERRQNQLKDLFVKTRPLIECLYSRVLKECAVQEVFIKLDAVDNSFYQLGSKYERLHIFNKEQRQEAQQALNSRLRSYKKFGECVVKKSEL